MKTTRKRYSADFKAKVAISPRAIGALDAEMKRHKLADFGKNLAGDR
jgi:hypothetical protein